MQAYNISSVELFTEIYNNRQNHIMTEGIQTFANYRQTYKAKHYINSLKHVNEVLKLAQKNKKALGKMNKYM